MKPIRLSLPHKDSERILFILLFLALVIFFYTILYLTSSKDKNILFIIGIIGLVLDHLFYGRYYNVFFDESTLYYSSFFSSKKIPISSIKEIYTNDFFTERFFFSKRISIVIALNDETKIRCLSKSIDYNSEIEESSEYKRLLEFIDTR